jgi:hypothetical protein
MSFAIDTAAQWTDAFVLRLRETWPNLSLGTLRSVAHEMRRDPELGELPGAHAAVRWLDRSHPPMSS